MRSIWSAVSTSTTFAMFGAFFLGKFWRYPPRFLQFESHSVRLTSLDLYPPLYPLPSLENGQSGAAGGGASLPYKLLILNDFLDNRAQGRTWSWRTERECPD